MARDEFQQVLQADPGNLSALFCLGMYFQHQGDNDKAFVYFARVYLADPDDPYVGFKYAESLIATGKTEEGVQALEKVIERDPGCSGPGVYRLALEYRRTGGAEQAKPLLMRFQNSTRLNWLAAPLPCRKCMEPSASTITYWRRRPPPACVGPNRPHRLVFSPDVREVGEPYAGPGSGSSDRSGCRGWP